MALAEKSPMGGMGDSEKMLESWGVLQVEERGGFLRVFQTGPRGAAAPQSAAGP